METPIKSLFSERKSKNAVRCNVLIFMVYTAILTLLQNLQTFFKLFRENIYAICVFYYNAVRVYVNVLICNVLYLTVNNIFYCNLL